MWVINGYKKRNGPAGTCTRYGYRKTMENETATREECVMIVIKAGGASGVNLVAIYADLTQLIATGEQVVLVHGGSAEANALGYQLGHPPQFLTSVSGVQSRYTDATTLETLLMAMAGKIKPHLVTLLQQRGIPAVGLTGLDGAQIQARQKAALKVVMDDRVHIIHDDLTGRIEQVDATLLRLLLQAGYTPVL